MSNTTLPICYAVPADILRTHKENPNITTTHTDGNWSVTCNPQNFCTYTVTGNNGSDTFTLDQNRYKYYTTANRFAMNVPTYDIYCSKN